jgi:hypothetical protein
MPLDISPSISTININGHTYTHSDWEDNTPGTISGIANDISDLSGFLADSVGIVTKTISTSVTLSPEESTNVGFVFEGSLSGVATITFDAGFTGLAQIENQTTGGFGLLCGLASGTKVSVPASGSCAAICDGTNFGLQNGVVRTSTGCSVVGTLAVSGAATITGALTASSTANITGSATVGGALTGSSTANFTGAATVGGALSVGGALTGTSANFSGNSTVGGAQQVTGAQTVTGAASFGSSITAAGEGTVEDVLNIIATDGTDGIIRVRSKTDGTGDFQFFTGNTGDSNLRWAIYKDASSEGGANAGSNLVVACYDDSGTIIGTPFVIERSTGHIIFNMGLMATSASGLASGTMWNNSGVATFA